MAIGSQIERSTPGVADLPRGAHGDQCVTLRDVGWRGYSTLLRLRGERSSPRMVYLDGTVWLMSPSFPHERLQKRLGWVVEVIVEELDIPFIPAGSTTLRRRKKRGGIEGDQTYYLANATRIRGKDKINLKADPAPDLAIEAVLSHDADAAIAVWRRFKVPEVWVCDEIEMRILILQPNGRFAESPTSASFPFLSAAEIYDWVHRSGTPTELEWLKQLRAWAKRTLKPRFRRINRSSGPDETPNAGTPST
jgi:Uma2 family endonuclease